MHDLAYPSHLYKIWLPKPRHMWKGIITADIKLGWIESSIFKKWRSHYTLNCRQQFNVYLEVGKGLIKLKRQSWHYFLDPHTTWNVDFILVGLNFNFPDLLRQLLITLTLGRVQISVKVVVVAASRWYETSVGAKTIGIIWFWAEMTGGFHVLVILRLAEKFWCALSYWCHIAIWKKW